MCLGALRGEHSLKVARSSRAVEGFPLSRFTFMLVCWNAACLHANLQLLVLSLVPLHNITNLLVSSISSPLLSPSPLCHFRFVHCIPNRSDQTGLDILFQPVYLRAATSVSSFNLLVDPFGTIGHGCCRVWCHFPMHINAKEGIMSVFGIVFAQQVGNMTITICPQCTYIFPWLPNHTAAVCTQLRTEHTHCIDLVICCSKTA